MPVLAGLPVLKLGILICSEAQTEKCHWMLCGCGKGESKLTVVFLLRTIKTEVTASHKSFLVSGSKLGKEYIKVVYCHPAYVTHMQSTSWEMPGWMKHKLESRLPEEISITSDMQMAPYGRKWRGTKKPPFEKGQWKSWLKTQQSKDDGIWSHPFKANRWGNNRNIDRLYFGLQNHCITCCKITAAMKLKDAYSLEGKLW